jgi:hypothetical protein
MDRLDVAPHDPQRAVGAGEADALEFERTPRHAV